MPLKWRMILIALLVVIAVETIWLSRGPTGSPIQPVLPNVIPFVEPTNPLPLDRIATALIGRPVFPTAIQTIAYSPDGESILAGDGLGRLIEFDREQKTTRQLQVHSNWVFSIRFDKAGDRLLSAGGDDSVRVFKWPGLGDAAVFAGHQKDVHGVAMFADSDRVASVGDDMIVRLWSVSNPVETRQLVGHAEAVTSVDVSGDGHWLATGSRDDSVRVWDASADFSHRVFSGHSNDVMSVRFLPGGKQLLSTGYDGQLLVWNVVDGKIAKRTITAVNKVFALATTRDGKWAVTGLEGGVVRLWDLGRPESILREHTRFQGEGDISSVAFSVDGSEIAAGSTTGEIHLWNRTNKWNYAKLSSPFRP